MTNGEVNKLGDEILRKKGEMNSEELKTLQEFRTSFQKPLTETFNKVRVISDKIYRANIIAFRLKRISTIANKIQREPGMRLSRMGDIAGIRCIFSNEKEIYKTLEKIKEEFEVNGRVRDYIKDPKEIGYKGVHVYIKDKGTNKRIEIQLRTFEHHNWATLVEITDLLFNLRLKELGSISHPKFSKFHSFMSSNKELTKEEADLIYSVLDEYKFISVLSSTFRKNNNEVKKKWLSEDKNNCFFLIEASKEKIPDLKSFSTFEEAEEAYFKKYQDNPEAEIVLTSIRKPNFRQISIAYANYILSYHTFISDIRLIIQELAKEAMEDKQYWKFRKIFKTYEELQAGLILNFLAESADLLLHKYDQEKSIVNKGRKMSKVQEKKIRKEIHAELNSNSRLYKEFMRELENHRPPNFLPKYFFNAFIKKHDKRMKKILQRNKEEFDNLFKDRITVKL